jgi:alpha-beta hydrolase superfamily lysophospholipase
MNERTPATITELAFHSTDGLRLAYRRREGRGPTILFLPGYASDMDGTKAVALDAFAARCGYAMTRLDYSGTGSSEGEFEAGTLARWADEALFILENQTEGPVVLVGSSMGGWIALHLRFAGRSEWPPWSALPLRPTSQNGAFPIISRSASLPAKRSDENFRTAARK